MASSLLPLLILTTGCFAQEPPDVRELEARFHRGVALLNEGRFDEAARALAELAADAVEQGASEVEIVALSNLANAHFYLGDFAASRRAAFAGIEALEDPDDPRRWFFSNTLGATYLRAAEYAEALEWFEAELLRPHGEIPQVRAVLYSNIGVAELYLHEYESALSTLELARGLHRECGNDAGLADAHSTTGDVLMMTGGLEAALEHQLTALEIRERLGNPERIALSQRSLASVRHALDQHDEALELLDLALATERELGLEDALSASLLMQSEVLRSAGRTEDAVAAAEECLALAERLGIPAREAAARVLLDSLRAKEELASPEDTVRRDEVLAARSENAERARREFRARFDAIEAEAALARSDAELRTERGRRNAMLWLSGGLLVVCGLSLALWQLRRRAYRELVRVHAALEEQAGGLDEAMDRIRALEGFHAICCYCKDVRDERGTWEPVEQFVSTHSPVEFSHGICPACLERVEREEHLI